jgi:hypothetical protein
VETTDENRYASATKLESQVRRTSPLVGLNAGQSNYDTLAGATVEARDLSDGDLLHRLIQEVNAEVHVSQ